MVIVATLRAADAAVKSVSTDGEATVYLAGNFAKPFDLTYRAVLKPGSRNKSWSTLSILLVGSQTPGPGASVGLASDPEHRSVSPFTYVVFPNQQYDYESRSGHCSDACVIELRGDRSRIYAYINRTLLASWSRSDLYLQHPSIQLNAEAHGDGDTIQASLTPIETSIAGDGVAAPACAFTTRGIEPAGRSTLVFSGKTNDNAGAYVNLTTGARKDKC